MTNLNDYYCNYEYSHCFLCGKQFDDSNPPTTEHIIPDALGGRLKSRILCKHCNDNLGATVDNKLCAALDAFTFRVAPRTKHGKAKPLEVTMNGYPMKLNQDGSLTSEVKFTDNKVQYIGSEITPTVKRRMDQIVAGKLKSNLFQSIQTTQVQNPILSKKISFEAEDINFGLIKIAIEYALLNGIQRDELVLAINMLNAMDEELASNHVRYQYPKFDFLPGNGIYHMIILVGDPTSHELFCYISLYGVLQTKVIVSNQYTSQKKVVIPYIYDVWNEKVPNDCLPSCDELYETLTTTSIIFDCKDIKDACTKFMEFFSWKRNDLAEITERWLNKSSESLLNSNELLDISEFKENLCRLMVESKPSELRGIKDYVIFENFPNKILEEIYSRYNRSILKNNL